MKIMKTAAILVLLALLMCLPAIPSAAAFKSDTSGNNIQISNLGYGAHNYTGGNYTLDFSLVEQAVANPTSSNYSAYLGFYSPMLYFPPSGPFDILVNAPSSVSPGADVASTVYLLNKNLKTGGDYVVNYWIKDASGNILVGPGQVTVMAPPMVTTEAVVSLNAPGSAGSYFFWARVNWGTAYAEASDPFIVTSGTSPPGGGTGGVGGGGITLPPANLTGAANATNATNATQTIIIGGDRGILQIVKQPMEIYITECGIQERLFYLMNRGNGSLRNISLFISGLPLDSYTIEPAIYEKLEPNDVAAFKVTFVKLPQPGEYDIVLIVTSSSGTDTMPGKVVVGASSCQLGGPNTPILTTYMLIFVAIILALLFIIGSFILRRHSQKVVVDRNLVDYIEMRLGEGYSPSALRRELLKEGWKEKEITDAISVVKSDKKEKANEKSEKSGSAAGGRIEPIE